MSEAPHIRIDWKRATWGENSVVLGAEPSHIALHRDGPSLLWGKRILRFDSAEVRENVRYGDTGDYHYVQVHLKSAGEEVAVLAGCVGQIHDDPIAGEAQEVLAAEAEAFKTARRLLVCLGLRD